MAGPEPPAELIRGLWRWTAPHPDWRPPSRTGGPDDWEQLVGCALYETERAVTFFDPLVGPDAGAFWAWADARVAGRPVHVLTTIHWHRRSRDAVVARYGAQTSRARARLPAGIEPVVLRGAGETMFWLPGPRALIPGDRLLGAPGGGLRICPQSWLSAVRVDRYELRALLAPVLELPVARVLVSHGRPVLRGGAGALRAALSA